MKINCPHCSVTLECDGSSAGQLVACPECNGNFTVPIPAATAVNKKNDSSAHKVENTISSGCPSWLPYIPALVLGVILLPCFGVGLLVIIVAIWKRHSMTYVLTNKNLKVVRGVLIKSEATVRIKDIRGISVKRGFFDALTGCGSLIVGTAATADAEIIISHIKDVKHLQAQLNSLQDEADRT